MWPKVRGLAPRALAPRGLEVRGNLCIRRMRTKTETPARREKTSTTDKSGEDDQQQTSFQRETDQSSLGPVALCTFGGFARLRTALLFAPSDPQQPVLDPVPFRKESPSLACLRTSVSSDRASDSF